MFAFSNDLRLVPPALLTLAALVAGCGDDDKQPKRTPVDAGAAGNDGMSGAGGEGGCQPSTCEDLGVECGIVDNGCGRSIECDVGCATAGAGGDAGGRGGSGGECEPTTCVAEGKDCGTIDDGCGKELECGTCAGSVCGAVIENVCGCPEGGEPSELERLARRARSAGFSGTIEQYGELYDIVCEDVADCASACVERGGEVSMCDASECLESSGGTRDCLPAPIWTNLESIRFEATDVIDTTQIVLVDNAYHDVLIADDFQMEIPESAEIRGISVGVRRAGDDTVADDSVRIVKGGAIGSAERALPALWTTDLTWATYGGPEDLWGETWTPAELNAEDFGVAFSVVYTQDVGNTRAYVDLVRVTVHYAVACE